MGEFNDELLVTPAMRERLDLEAVPDHTDQVAAFPWFAWLQRSNGSCQRIANQLILPTEDQQQFMLALLRMLNAELRHGGFWVTGWVQPIMFRQDLTAYVAGQQLTRTFTKGICMWADSDGDVQFTMEIVDSMWKIERCSIESWVEQAGDAWAAWYEHMRGVLAPTEGQLYKRAQGQRRPSLH